MKPQKLEPYQRSRHRAALHAWVVAATAVAAIGMPASASAGGVERDQHQQHQGDDLTPAQAAQRVVEQWIDALTRRDRDAVLATMLPPADVQSEARLFDQLDALSGQLVAGDLSLRPHAQRHAGHWAVSAWQIQPRSADPIGASLLQPIALYNPVIGHADDPASRWAVVPNGYVDDAALAPLYNADYDGLAQWYQALGA